MTKSTKKTFSRAAKNNDLRVIDYQDADAALKDRMDVLMDAIDRTPEKREAVTSYGIGSANRLHALYKKLEGLSLCEITEQAEDLLPKFREAFLEINACLGAAPEVERRYEQEYIKNAAREAKASKDPEDAEYLKDLKQRKEDFRDHTIVLEGARAYGRIAITQLDVAIERKQNLQVLAQADSTRKPAAKKPARTR